MAVAVARAEQPPPVPGPRYSAMATSNGMPALLLSDGASMTPVPAGAGAPPAVRLSGVTPTASPSGVPGIFMALPEQFERAASGHDVKVTVLARRAPGARNASFAVAYSTNEVGNSGWRPFPLADAFTSYSFTYPVEKLVKGEGDYIGILPDPEGVDGAVEVAEISAEVMLPPGSPAAQTAPAAPAAAAQPGQATQVAPAASAEAPVAAAQTGQSAEVTPAAPAASAEAPVAAAANTAPPGAPPPPPDGLPGKGPYVSPATYYDVALRVVKLPADGNRGGIAAVGRGLVIASGNGRLFYLPDLANPAPESIVELKEVPPFDLSNPKLGHLRKTTRTILGVGAEPSRAAAGAWDLYVSMIEYDDKQDCITAGLWQAVVGLHGDAAPSIDRGWQRVFRAKPCLPLAEFKHEASLYEAGGRISFDKDGILLTLGLGSPIARQLSPDGSDPTKAYTQLDDYDYGKVMRIDRASHAVTHISKGHRNPQGLFVDSDGTIFETEHGPQGGDEINIITPGSNYGWPVMTYGTQYGKRDWEFPPPKDESPYALPLYSFVPSIGISELVRLTGDEFPRWKGDLMVASLSGGSSGTKKGLSLYRLRYREGRIIFAEPIFVGERLRDILEAPDGKLVVLTDSTKLLVVSNATTEGLEAQVPNPEAPAAPKPSAAGAAPAEVSVSVGESLFEKKCSTCHGLQAGNRDAIAPALGCAAGSKVASSDSYAYSAALKARAGDVWTVENLRTFLRNPAAWAPGTRMVPPEVNEGEIANVIAYLDDHKQKACH